MKFTIIFKFLVFALLVLQSCKKDDPVVVVVVPEPVIEPNIAPCVINETVYPIDSVFYNSDFYFPEAKFRLEYTDTNGGSVSPTFIEFAFDKIPTTGMYRLVHQIDTSAPPNQMAYVIDAGGFEYRSTWNLAEDVYIENSNSEIIISFCDLVVSLNFDPVCNCFIGNALEEFKIRKQL